jgi:hypothetical protein
MTSLEGTAYELAVRALAQQEQALTELRARTATLLTASSLIASFLGAQAIGRNGLNVWIVLALVAFGLSVVFCIYVLLPKEGLIFALDAPDTYEALYVVRDDEEEFTRRLVYWVQGFREGNHPTIERLTRTFEVAGIALLFEIGLLAAGLAVG